MYALAIGFRRVSGQNRDSVRKRVGYKLASSAFAMERKWNVFEYE